MSETTDTSADPTGQSTTTTDQGKDQQQEQQQQQQGDQAKVADKPYYETWSPDLKESQIVLRHKTPEDLARSLVAAEKRLGVPADQLVRLPTGPDDKDGFATAMKAFGAPDTPDGYKIELAPGATDDAKALGTEFAKAMHAVSAPPVFVKAAIDFLNAQTTAQAEADRTAAENANAAAEAELKKEWGGAYETRSKEIGRLLNELGGKDLAAELDRSGLGSNVQLLRAMGKMLDKMAEPGTLEGQGRGKDTTGVLTPGQAKAKRLELETDQVKGKALTDAAHPMHKAVVEERNRYLGMETAQAS